ncbi:MULTISPECIES: hypothetical protein [unclassified Agrococcus]|uniref:hypothetical protein n=1 Tax=unclassified Agrococcus TaxID=2615065 RepID=UPI00360A812C
MADLHVTLQSGTELALSNAGTPFAEHLVILCNPLEVTGLVDPDPVVTARHPVHLLVADPVVQADRTQVTPTQQASAIAEYVREAQQTGARTGARDLRNIGVVGWGSGALVAVSLVLDHPGLFTKIALVAPDLAEGPSTAAPLPDLGDGPSTGTLDDRLARGLVPDEDTARIAPDDADSLADRWRSTRIGGGGSLVIDPERLPQDHGTTDLEWATDALVGSWERVLAHVQHDPSDDDEGQEERA